MAVLPDSRQEVAEAGGGRATYRIADAVDFADPQLEDVRRAGITTVLLSPDPDGVFSGQLTAVKLVGQTLKERLAAAIAREEYELAAELRDELARRTQIKH